MNDVHHFGLFLRTYLAQTLSDDVIWEIEQHYFLNLKQVCAQSQTIGELHYLGLKLGIYRAEYQVYTHHMRGGRPMLMQHPSVDFDIFIETISKYNQIYLQVTLSNLIKCFEKFKVYVKGLPVLALFFYNKGLKSQSVKLLFATEGISLYVQEIEDEAFLTAVSDSLKTTQD